MPEYLKKGLPEHRDESMASRVREILQRVRDEGDTAVRYYSRKFDHWDPPSFRVDLESAAKARTTLSPDLIRSVEFVSAQIRGFAELQLGAIREFEHEVLPGVLLGHRHIPISSVGAYVPGGRYPLLVSPQMSILTAKVAGVDRVIACAPPFEGRGIHPGVLWSMHLAGADEIYCVGGAQAVAMMAFGTESVEGVAMVSGCGNRFVAEAKRQLYGRVGIDLIAGPSEIVVIADETADPAIVAADLLAQAEHDVDAKARLVSLSRSFAEAVIAEVDRQLEVLPTSAIALQSWAVSGEVVLVDDYAEAVAVANEYASEHVEVQTADNEYFLRELRDYGMLILGEESTVAFADKALGVNHVLPTGGAARYATPLWVGVFLRTVSYQSCTRKGAMMVAEHTARISDAEGLSGHARSARMRVSKYQEPDDR